MYFPYKFRIHKGTLKMSLKAKKIGRGLSSPA
nr:MAG TPA: hypothetical protein [Caudoviricetes sp.]